MNKPPKRKFTGKYDNQFKIAIVKEYLSTDLGARSLSKKYDVPTTTIYDFIKWYKARYPDGVVVEVEPASTPPPGNKDLKEAELKITALQMLIENASKELGIDLVKKFGTKQSGK